MPVTLFRLGVVNPPVCSCMCTHLRDIPLSPLGLHNYFPKSLLAQLRCILLIIPAHSLRKIGVIDGVIFLEQDKTRRCNVSWKLCC